MTHSVQTNYVIGKRLNI